MGHVGGVDEVVVDQSAGAGWRLLGRFDFAPEGDHFVALGDATGEPYVRDGVRLVFDAVRLAPMGLDEVLDAAPEVDAAVDAGAIDAEALPMDAAPPVEGLPDAQTRADASVADANTAAPPPADGGGSGGCQSAPGDTGTGLLLLLFGALLARERRRRSS